MHLIPTFLREDSADFYECPAELFSAEKHSVFTRDFDSIHMVLDTSTIYYYGIDTETLTPKISELNYSQSEKRHLLSSETENGYIKRCQGTGKGITISAKCQITDKRTCKVFDLSSPLLYHGAVGCVRSVKDCLRRIGFALFLDLTIIHHYKSFPTISKRISYCLLNDSIVCPL